MANDQERAAFEAALSQLSDGTYLMPGWDVRRARSALAAAPVQALPDAVKIVLDAMRADPGYAWSWHCNIAMAFVDEGGDHAMANHAAARFMRLLADVEPAHELPEKAAPAAPQVPEAVAVGKMTAQRAKFFLQRFKLTEKLLGPNEQAGLDYAIAALEREQYAAQQPAERVPLTVPEILELMPEEVPASYDGQLIEFARAIEQAHGIRAAGVKEPANARDQRRTE